MIYLISPTGELISGKDYNTDVHYWLDKKLGLDVPNTYLGSVKVHKYVRLNDGERFDWEVAVQLSDVITDAQLITAEDWLYEICKRRAFVVVEIEATDTSNQHVYLSEKNCNFYKRYEFSQYSVEDIMVDIKSYYRRQS